MKITNKDLNAKGFLLGLLVSAWLMNVASGETVKKTIEVVKNSVNLTVNGKDEAKIIKRICKD